MREEECEWRSGHTGQRVGEEEGRGEEEEEPEQKQEEKNKKVRDLSHLTLLSHTN